MQKFPFRKTQSLWSNICIGLPFQTKILPSEPWSRMKQSLDSSALWEKGFSAATSAIAMFPLASDTWRIKNRYLESEDLDASKGCIDIVVPYRVWPSSYWRRQPGRHQMLLQAGLVSLQESFNTTESWIASVPKHFKSYMGRFAYLQHLLSFHSFIANIHVGTSAAFVVTNAFRELSSF